MVENASTLCFLPKMFLKYSRSRSTSRLMCNTNSLKRFWQILIRSSHWRCSIKNGVIKNFEKSTGKNLCYSPFLPATLFKKRLLRRCFPVNFAELLWISFLQETSWWLLLKVLWRFLRPWSRETYETKCSRMDQVKFVEDKKLLKFFNGCLPQILLGPFLDTLSHMYFCRLCWNITWSHDVTINVLRIFNLSDNVKKRNNQSIRYNSDTKIIRTYIEYLK